MISKWLDNIKWPNCAQNLEFNHQTLMIHLDQVDLGGQQVVQGQEDLEWRDHQVNSNHQRVGLITKSSNQTSELAQEIADIYNS